MRNGILTGLSLVAAAGIVFVLLRGGPQTPEPLADAPAGSPEKPAPSAPASKVSEIDRGAPATPPMAKQEAAPAPGTPRPDPRVTRVDEKVYFNDPITLVRNMHSETTTPEDDVSAVGTALRYYQLVYKENPFGSLNAEIVDQLVGNNPKGIVVIPPDHPDINAKGELVDRWGTPYFFHGLTRTAMDVWSAGPDLDFGSVDDVKLGADEEFGAQLGLLIDP